MTPISPQATAEADAAIREARAGKLAIPEMLRVIMSAQVFVPVAGLPKMEGNEIRSWNPATANKEPGSSSFLLVFTDSALASAFSKSNPSHSHCLLVELSWLLGVLPPNHGIAFNSGGASGFEWPASGIAAYRAENA